MALLLDFVVESTLTSNVQDDLHQTTHVDNDFLSKPNKHNPRNNSPTESNVSPKHWKGNKTAILH